MYRYGYGLPPNMACAVLLTSGVEQTGTFITLQTKNKLEEEDSTMEIHAALEAEGAKVNPRPGAPHPDLRRWIRQTMGGAAIAATLHGAPAHADAYCSSLHGVQNSVNVGVHLGFAFGALGWPVKLNYGVTLRLGRQAAGFARIEGLGISAFHLTAGATGIFGESAFLEGGVTKSIGMGSAAGLHLGTGPANNAVGLLLGGFIPVVGPSSDWSAQIAPSLFLREICFPSGRALRVGASVALQPTMSSATQRPRLRSRRDGRAACSRLAPWLRHRASIVRRKLPLLPSRSKPGRMAASAKEPRRSRRDRVSRALAIHRTRSAMRSCRGASSNGPCARALHACATPSPTL